MLPSADADMFLKRVPLFQPQPLAFLEEDIREVLKQETGSDIFNRADVHLDYRAWKHVCVCPVVQLGLNSLERII